MPTYCNARNDLLPEARCNRREEHLKVSLMNHLGPWGTNLEIFLAAQITCLSIILTNNEECKLL